MRVLRFLFIALSFGVVSCAGGGVHTLPSSGAVQAQSSVSAPFTYAVHPRVERISDLLLHNCPAGTSGCALSPTTVRTAYNFSYVSSTQDGTGQKIIIVVAYGSPTIQNDLHTFDMTFGLPDVTITPVYPGGTPTVNLSNATQLGWAEETTLDVEWAHASAPGASIILVVANNDQGQTFQSALQFVASNAAYSGAAMSLSFGTPESAINGGANNTQLKAAEAVYTSARLNGMTVIASAGDLGATNGFASPNPQYPASDPNVLGVGGTNLTLFNNGRYKSEAAWDDGIACVQPCGATGGAPSTIFTWTNLNTGQAALTGNAVREVPDVAFAANDKAVDIYIGFTSPLGVTPGWYAIGGTSVGPPVYAGIVAIANQLRAAQTPAKLPVAFVDDVIYNAYAGAQLSKSPPFHDVTSGSNVFLPAGSAGEPAGPGYDMATGLGTPNINNLLSLLTGLP